MSGQRRRLAAGAPAGAWRRMLAGLLSGLLALASAAGAAPLHLVFEDYPPYEYLDGGEPTGINVRILREVGERLGLALRLEPLPWMRAIHLAEHGEVDGIFSLFKNAERERFLVFPDVALSRETNVLLTSRLRPVAVASREDLRGKSVGVVAGNAYGSWFDAADWIDKHPVTGSERLLRKQADGRTDVSVSNAQVANFLIQRLQLQDQLIVLDFIVSDEPLYIAFPRARGAQSERLAQQFSATLQAMQEEGRIEAIQREFATGQAATPAQTPSSP